MLCVHLASEVYPFSRTGMLGDSVYGMAKYVARMGVETYVITPLYGCGGCVEDGRMVHFADVRVTAGGMDYSFECYRAEQDGVHFLFMRNDEFYCRRYVYGTSEYDYSDNDIRYGMFSLACLELIKNTGLDPDIIHCHEWQTGLVPVYKHLYYKDMRAKTVFTVHDMNYQGVFSKFSVQSLGLPWEMYNVDELEFYENISMLKGGASHADFITFLSPSYAKEVQNDEFSFGLGSFMSRFADKTEGILCGIDYERFDPEHDEYIKKQYTAETAEAKEENKEDFISGTGLKGGRPLFLVETKFNERKGLELIADCADRLGSMDADFCFYGYGSAVICSRFKEIANLYDNIHTGIGINEETMHKAYAAADFVLRPSMSEPCGKSQMVGMRYGALPVVRRTGGLKDTVTDISEGGYGFMMDGYSRHDLLTQINRAIEFFSDRTIFYKSAARVMRLDFSCMKTAEKLIAVYRRILGGSNEIRQND